MLLETERLYVTDLLPDMAEAIWRNSRDEDNRRFVPDEVYDTLEEAEQAVHWLIQAAHTADGPFVYPVTLKKTGGVIGYVQACAAKEGMESAALPWCSGERAMIRAERARAGDMCCAQMACIARKDD